MTAKPSATLTKRVQRLEDLDAIRDLMALCIRDEQGYGEGRRVRALPSIFALDATWEGHGQRVVGLENIEESGPCPRTCPAAAASRKL